jgi:hypothetical protein
MMSQTLSSLHDLPSLLVQSSATSALRTGRQESYHVDRDYSVLMVGVRVVVAYQNPNRKVNMKANEASDEEGLYMEVERLRSSNPWPCPCGDNDDGDEA